MRHHACEHTADCRHWNGKQWVYPAEVSEALDAAVLAIDEYYNGDRAWAEEWLLKAAEANIGSNKEKSK
jgi:hypothetical protein